MTDKERFIELLKSFGIGFRENGPTLIEIEEGMNKVDGYFGFGAYWYFNKNDGSFDRLEIFE